MKTSIKFQDNVRHTILHELAERTFCGDKKVRLGVLLVV